MDERTGRPRRFSNPEFNNRRQHDSRENGVLKTLTSYLLQFTPHNHPVPTSAPGNHPVPSSKVNFPLVLCTIRNYVGIEKKNTAV